MAIVFLQAVNATLKRTRTIQGDVGELATSTVTSTATGLTATEPFTDSGRQVQIDLVIQMWQEALHEVYSMGEFASGMASATIGLVADQQEYSLPSDFERIAGDTTQQRSFRGVTNGLLVKEYQGGYAQLVIDRPIATDYLGQPTAYTLSPVSGKLVFDTVPTSAEAGESYHLLYHKRLALTSTMATETLPFSDTVADALVPVVASAHNAVMKKEFDRDLFQLSIVRAVKGVTRTTDKARWGIRRGA